MNHAVSYTSCILEKRYESSNSNNWENNDDDQGEKLFQFARNDSPGCREIAHDELEAECQFEGNGILKKNLII